MQLFINVSENALDFLGVMEYFTRFYGQVSRTCKLSIVWVLSYKCIIIILFLSEHTGLEDFTSDMRIFFLLFINVLEITHWCYKG